MSFPLPFPRRRTQKGGEANSTHYLRSKEKEWIPAFAGITLWLCTIGAAWFAAAFIYVASESLRYPFNLEWMEGQSIDVIQRVVGGLPVYAKPSIDYVAFLYTPLYFYVSAFVALFTGVDFFPARLVSFMATLGSGALIYTWVRREGGDRKAGIIGAGLFFATYRLSGRWFDNARVDSLALFLTLAGIFIFTHFHGRRQAVFAAILMAAAFFTKQSALIMVLPVLVGEFFLDKRHALLTAGVMVPLIIGGVLAGDALSDGWFSFYVFKVPAGHGMDRRLLWNFWTGDLFHALGILVVIAALFLVVCGVRDWKKGLYYGMVATGGIGAAYIARLHGFGYINVLMPAHAVLALLVGLAFAHCQRHAHSFVLAGLALLVMLQMKTLIYNPKPLIPSQESVEAGNRFLENLAKIDGDVFIPELQFVQTRVGKKSYALGMAAFDIMRSDLKDKNYIKLEFREELAQAVASGRFSAIIPGRLVPIPQLQKYYRFQQRLQYPKEYVTGAINFLRTDVFMRIPSVNQQP